MYDVVPSFWWIKIQDCEMKKNLLTILVYWQLPALNFGRKKKENSTNPPISRQNK